MITIDEVCRIVCQYYKMDIKIFHSKTRKREVVLARQLAMYFSVKILKKGTETTGLDVGGKTHATVLHAIKKVNNLTDVHPDIRWDFENIEFKIKKRCSIDKASLKRSSILKYMHHINMKNTDENNYAHHEIKAKEQIIRHAKTYKEFLCDMDLSKYN